MDAFQNMTLDGYDHIVNVKDKEDNSIIDIGKVRGHIQLVEFLEGVREFEVYFLSIYMNIIFTHLL